VTESGVSRRAIGIAWLFVKFAVAAGLFAWIAHIIDFDAALDAVLVLPPLALIAALLVLIAQAYLSAWRWALVSAQIGGPLQIGQAFSLSMVSVFYFQALPTPVASDAARVFGAVRCGLRLETALQGVLLDRILSLCGLLFLVCVSQAALSLTGLSNLAAPAVFGATLLAAGGMTLAVLWPAFWSRLLPGRLGRAVGRFAAMTARLVRAPNFPGVFLLTLVIHVLSLIAAYSLVWGLSLPLSFWQAGLALPSVILAQQLPISIGGWGVREGSMVLVLAGFGIDGTQAVALSVLFGLVQVAVGLIGGLFIFVPLRPPVSPGPA